MYGRSCSCEDEAGSGSEIDGYANADTGTDLDGVLRTFVGFEFGTLEDSVGKSHRGKKVYYIVQVERANYISRN